MQSPLRLIIALLLLALPLLELALLIKAGQAFGFWPVVLTVVATGLLGAHVIRTQGIATFQRISDALENGREPHRELADGALRLLAGGLLLLPGPITDTIGALLMIPLLRRIAANVIFARASIFGVAVRGARRRPTQDGAASQAATPREPDRSTPGEGQIIEGEFERIEERTVDPSRYPPRRPPKE